jgi:putative ABC transport system permease protein
VAIVNEELASQWLQGLDPIGARLLVDDNDGPPRPVEIVGVVGNVQQVALDGGPTWDLYLTYPQVHPDNVGTAAANMFFIVRTTGDPMNLAASLAREVRRTDPEVAASQIRPMDHYLADAMAPRRFSLSLMAVFALAALALAITGIYAVVVCSVSQRAPEFAIRSALGARRNDLLLLVVRQGVTPALFGIALGLGAAFAITRTLSSMLFGLSAVDPTTFVVVPSGVLLVALAACLGPGLRASGAAIHAAAARTF